MQAHEQASVVFNKHLTRAQVLQAFKKKVVTDCMNIYRNGSYLSQVRNKQPVFPSMLGDVYMPQQQQAMGSMNQAHTTSRPVEARPMDEGKQKIKRSTVE